MTQCTEVAIEEWRPVVGYEGWYDVSSKGNVRRIGRRGRGVPYKILTPKQGDYPRVTLSKFGRKSTLLVHRLVAIAYLQQIDGKPEVNHKDGEKWNSVPENLEWVTTSENAYHALRTGLRKCGEQMKNAKLTNQDAINIKKQVREGRSMLSLSKEYGLSFAAVQRLNTGKTWKHIP